MSACSHQKGLEPKSFSFNAIAKSDIDMVSEAHLAATLSHLRELADKLYKRNPAQWRKVGQPSRAAAIEHIFKETRPLQPSKEAIGQIKQAFDEAYKGDRINLYISGLRGMLLSSYDNRREFFFFDELEAQKLYNCARNFEVAAWLLKSRIESKGQPYLLNNEIGTVSNLSFERLFGKMIAEQDMVAQIIANKNNRRIKNIIQTMVFLPI
jgi:hypothetical protein